MNRIGSTDLDNYSTPRLAAAAVLGSVSAP